MHLLAHLAPGITARGLCILQAAVRDSYYDPYDVFDCSGAEMPLLVPVQALVARSMEVMQHDAAPVNFSMITWALGSMNYHPGETYMKHMIEHLQTSQLIQKFDAQVCSPTLCVVQCDTISANRAPCSSLSKHGAMTSLSYSLKTLSS